MISLVNRDKLIRVGPPNPPTPLSHTHTHPSLHAAWRYCTCKACTGVFIWKIWYQCQRCHRNLIYCEQNWSQRDYLLIAFLWCSSKLYSFTVPTLIFPRFVVLDERRYHNSVYCRDVLSWTGVTSCDVFKELKTFLHTSRFGSGDSNERRDIEKALMTLRPFDLICK